MKLLFDSVDITFGTEKLSEKNTAAGSAAESVVAQANELVVVLCVGA